MLVYSLINTKKSALGNPGRGGGGGLRRNSDGNWVPGFSRGLGCTNSCLAELWALRDGLNLASDIGIENLIFEIDAFFFFFWVCWKYAKLWKSKKSGILRNYT